MRFFRVTSETSRTYILINVYFHRVVDGNSSPEQTQGVTIHSCMEFLAAIVEDNKHQAEPFILGTRMTALVEQHFPVLLPYLRLELESMNFAVPETFFHHVSDINLGHFKRSIAFYKV